MSEKGFFKTFAVGGFDKKAVLHYIDDLNENFRISEEQLKRRISELENNESQNQEKLTGLNDQAAKYNEQIASLNEHIESLKEQIEFEKSNNAELSDTILNVNNDNRKLSRQLEEADKEINIQTERFRQLQFRAEGLDQKSRKYDELTIEIGDLILEAKQTAENILHNAKSDSENILQSAKKDAENILNAAKNDAERLMNAVREDAQNVKLEAQSTVKSISAELDGLKYELARIRKNADDLHIVINNRIDLMESMIGETLQGLTAEPICSSDYAEEH